MTSLEEFEKKEEIKEKENLKNMTPVEELERRKKGYSENPYYKVDNSKFSDETIKKARKFIQGEEKFVAKAYKPLKNDKWTIGYGHTKGVKEGDIITKEEAERLYRQDFEEHSIALKSIKVPLTENQKISLTSLAFNLGVSGFKNSDLVKMLNKGDYKGAADELLNYNKFNGKFSNGLYDRRCKERELFLTPDD
jgi:lysozyme